MQVFSSVQVESEDIGEAMRQSAEASTLATRASFNHEMLAMLYFPDEHKWAVYTPLFGPIGMFTPSFSLLPLH